LIIGDINFIIEILTMDGLFSEYFFLFKPEIGLGVDGD
jgi:hypothetical protein